MVKVLFDWKEHELDLDKPAPFELLEKNFKGQMYVPIPLVRELARRLSRVIKDQWTSNEVVGDSIIIKSSATVVIDGVEFEGTAQDMLPITQLKKTTFPATARVLALAIKSALKRKFLFFESDYFWVGLSEEVIGDSSLSQSSNTNPGGAAIDKDTFQSYMDKIGKCTTVSELELVWVEVKNLITNNKVSWEQATTLRKAYNNKNQLL